jgi:hypothetical protein
MQGEEAPAPHEINLRLRRKRLRGETACLRFEKDLEVSCAVPRITIKK